METTRTARRRAASFIALTALLVSVMVPMAAYAELTASSPVSEGGVVPYVGFGTTPGGNVACSDITGLTFEFSTDRVSSPTNADFPAALGVDITGDSVAFSTEETVVVDAVIVKGSNDANVYVYDPASRGDSGLAAPPNASGDPAGLSNLTFCYSSVVPPSDPDLELLKVWQDEDGNPLSPVSDIDWSAEVRYGNGDPTGIEVGDETGVSDTGAFDSDRTSYRVVEETSSAFTEVACSQQVRARVDGDYADGRPTDFSGTNDGGRIAAPTQDTLHVICNTPLEDGPEPWTIDVYKLWFDVDGNLLVPTLPPEVTTLGIEFRVGDELVATRDAGDFRTTSFSGTVALPVPDGGGEDPNAWKTTIDVDSDVPASEVVVTEVAVESGYAEVACASLLTIDDATTADGAADGISAEQEPGSGQAEVLLVCNQEQPPPTIPSRDYYLDFDKEWVFDDETAAKVADLEQQGYDATFTYDGDEVVTEVALTAGTQEIAADGRRKVSLDTAYALDEQVVTEGLPETCEVATTFAYDGEELAGDFTTPSTARDDTTFTIDVTNEVICPVVEGEAFASVDVAVDKTWNATGVEGALLELDAPEGFVPTFAVTLTDADDDVVGEATQLRPGGVVSFVELEDEARYTLAWEEIEPPSEYENDAGERCVLNDERSTTAGAVTFTAGVAESVTLEAVNVYDCTEVLETVIEPDEEDEPATMPVTGVPALWLTVLGLLSLGAGGRLLRERRQR